jgi:hypothetical protein
LKCRLWIFADCFCQGVKGAKGGKFLTRIVLNVLDDRKAETLMALLRDLSYVDVQADDGVKVWDGKLESIDSPVEAGDFRIFSREELHER